LLKRNPVEASTRFSAIAAKGAATLPALLGLAESTMRDSLVVTSRQSPSGWRFRSNHQLAREALVRAADLAPKGLRAVCLERAAQLYIREPQQIRMGYADSVTKEYWFGLPSLYRDSVVVFPFSPSMHAARARESVPSTYAAALARERQGFYELTKSSAEELPRDARARSAFASALELRGQIAARGDEPDALKELVAALSLTSSEHERTEVRRAITRIRLKRLETGAASRVIDTLLTRTADSSGARDGLWKAALAAFRDDMAAVSTYLAAAWSDPAVAQEELGVDIDATTRQALAKFTAAVALGVCDSLASFEGQLEAAMRALVAPNDREIFRARTLGRLWSDATPCDHGARVRAIAQLPTSYATAQRSYARKDYHAARRQLLAAAALRGGSRGADQSWDAVFQEAWLHAAIGDTVTAIAVVEQALTSLPSASRFLTEQLSQAAGFVRAIRLKLDLTGRTSGQQQDRLRSVLDSLRAS
jgi:hypothetical protein